MAAPAVDSRPTHSRKLPATRRRVTWETPLKPRLVWQPITSTGCPATGTIGPLLAPDGSEYLISEAFGVVMTCTAWATVTNVRVATIVAADRMAARENFSWRFMFLLRSVESHRPCSLQGARR